MMPVERPPVYTIGHSTRSIAEFVELLRHGRVELVVDIRSFPRSRTNPQFNLDALPEALAAWQIGHQRIAELGGRRKKSEIVLPDVNGFWINQSFHNYADYALSDEFRAGFSRLTELIRERRCAIMCSEAVWWRCHRRFVADYLLHDGRDVFHLMGTARIDVAEMNPAARAEGASLVYPAQEVTALQIGQAVVKFDLYPDGAERLHAMGAFGQDEPEAARLWDHLRTRVLDPRLKPSGVFLSPGPTGWLLQSAISGWNAVVFNAALNAS